MKRFVSVVILTAACAGASSVQQSAAPPGDTYDVVNGSACTVRIVLYDYEGKVIENIKYEDLRAGRTQRYRLPNPGMRLDAVAIDAMGNACSLTENQKIRITKVQ
jgi:hypothetical protein